MTHRILESLNNNYDGTKGTWEVIREWENERGEMGIYQNYSKPEQILIVVKLSTSVITMMEIRPASGLAVTMQDLRIIAAFAGAIPK